MLADAVILDAPHRIALRATTLRDPVPGEVVVAVAHSGISTGTERLLWSGRMPPFPGLSYPLVPGYEALGEVVEAPRGGPLAVGDTVFVPGAACFQGPAALFGGASSLLVTDPARAARLDPGFGPEGALLALAATARHALAGHALPQLIVGHGVLGRLLARLTIALGSPPPTVWEIEPARMTGAEGYDVTRPEDDPRRDYAVILDASGQASLLGDLIARLARGGEVVLAGFYAEPLTFAFPPAFLREARLRVAAEWTPADLVETRRMVESGALSLSGLVTHASPAAEASQAYATAFGDPACLKMILNWKDAA